MMEKDQMKKPILFLGFIFFIVILLTVVQVTVANQISTTGIELNDLQNKVSQYKKENAILEQRYLEVSSLLNIESKAEKLGFVDAKYQEFISTPLPLALRQ